MNAAILDPASYSFNVFAVPTVITAIATLTLGLVVLIAERQSRVSVPFFVMTLAATVWLSAYSVMDMAQNETTGTFWALIGQAGIIFIPAAVYHFTVGTLDIYRRHKSRVWLAWLVSAGFFTSVLSSGNIVDGVYLYGWGYYPKYSRTSIFFLGFFFGLMVLSLRHYWVEYRTASPGSTRNLRSKAFFRAFCIAYLGSVDFLPAFGFPLYPWGYVPVLAFITLTAQTISRYRLVDITPAFAAQEIINAMDDALVILDSEGIIRVANRAAFALFGCSESDFVGRPLRSLTQFLSAPERDLERLILSGSLRDLECALRDCRPGASAASVSSFVMQDASMRPIAFVCLIRDITRRKKAEQEIRRHTERQTALYEINLATTSTLELQTVLQMLLERLAPLMPGTVATMVFVSENEREFFKVASRGIDDIAWKSESERDDVPLHPVIDKKDVIPVYDLRIENDSLRSRYFVQNGFRSYLGVPLMAKEKVLGILSFYSREPRTFNDEEVNFLRSIAGQAAAAIHNSQLYEQTKKQAWELEKANCVKDEFLSVMSHELRTPLNVISGYTKIVQDGFLGKINAEQLKALDKVTRHANELLVMVNGMMDAAKIEAGVVVVEEEEFLLTAFLEDLKALFEYPLGKDVMLQWIYPNNLPLIKTDRDKLKHILQNLINNALKFTERGSVTVTARFRAASDSIEIGVSDTGVGIAEGDFNLIFDKFRQLDSSITRIYGGVGLGLHIVRTFVEILHGTVAAASHPGEGTTFTVTLPRVFPTPGKAPADINDQ